MVSFVKDAKICLVTKALLVGIGEVPEQQQEDGSYSPVCYASRKLSNVEKRHSQFEREALAVRWAYQKFCLHLYLSNFMCIYYMCPHMYVQYKSVYMHMYIMHTHAELHITPNHS